MIEFDCGTSNLKVNRTRFCVQYEKNYTNTGTLKKFRKIFTLTIHNLSEWTLYYVLCAMSNVMYH